MAVIKFACTCGDGGFGNIGLPACFSGAGLLDKDYFHNAYDKDGARNHISVTDFDENGKLTEEFILNKLTHPDPTKRWYPSPDYEDVAPSRTEDQVYTSAKGTIKKLRSGQMQRTQEVLDVPHNWASKINAATCKEVAVYSIDEKGAMSGEVSKDGTKFYGYLIQKGTLSAAPQEATTDKPAHTVITYQISRKSVEGLFLTISPEQIEPDLRLGKSLIEVDLTQGAGTNTNTEIFIDAFNITLGTFGNFHAFKGATALTDWKVYTSAGILGVEIVIAAVEEISDGKYKITLTADPATDVWVSMVKSSGSISDYAYIADQSKFVKP